SRCASTATVCAETPTPRLACASWWASRNRKGSENAAGSWSVRQRRQKVQWARLVSNQRPLACEASALPLSYAPSEGDSRPRASRERELNDEQRGDARRARDVIAPDRPRQVALPRAR